MEKHSKLIPLGKNVLVKQLPKDKQTKSGIIISGGIVDERPYTGTVIAVGADLEKSSLIKVGVSVTFKKYAVDDIEIEGVLHLMLDEKDITGVFKD